MILFFDEDVGVKIPQALSTLGLKVDCMRDRGWLRRDDIEWLPDVGKERFLVYSHNKKMLTVSKEREAIIKESVGIVFMTDGQLPRPEETRLIIAKWQWFEQIDTSIERPFAFYLYPSGQTKRML